MYNFFIHKKTTIPCKDEDGGFGSLIELKVSFIRSVLEPEEWNPIALQNLLLP
jgi:hypothetical protein